ncbi:MAG: hypothetical protein IKA47_00315, partial [Oscillospiraceae bacterium]|nr:hypothetical protein [Oscillospiraceae bacterium]
VVYFFIALVTKWYSFLIAFLGRVAWFFNSAGGLVFFEHWPSFFLTFAGELFHICDPLSSKIKLTAEELERYMDTPIGKIYIAVNEDLQQ